MRDVWDWGVPNASVVWGLLRSGRRTRSSGGSRTGPRLRRHWRRWLFEAPSDPPTPTGRGRAMYVGRLRVQGWACEGVVCHI